MRLNATTTLLALALAAAPVAASAQNPAPAAARPKPAQLPKDSMELARKYTNWLYMNQSDSLVAHSDSVVRAQPEQKGTYEQRSLTVAERAGDEVKVLDEKFITRNGTRQYWRTATFTNAPEPILIRWVMSAKGEILAIGLGPASQAPPVDP
jgi:ABC-type sulfate transport system substrate-binding protein